MCFGGGSSPAAPVETPAVPVDQISAGQPTITVAPNSAATAAAAAPAPTTSSPAASQVSGSTGLDM